MTNDLDRLLEQVKDALEDSGDGIWQPDLAAPVLPAFTQDDGRTSAETAPGTRTQGSVRELESLPSFSALEEGQAAEAFSEVDLAVLPQVEREGDTSSLSSRQTEQEERALNGNTSSVSPALLEQLQTLENMQAHTQALGRSPGSGGSLSPRFQAGQGGGVISYDPAALGDFPLAAAAAAAQEEDRARAVDRAFQRDSRRYDRGFSLY